MYWVCLAYTHSYSMGKPGFIVSEEKLRLLQIERAVERFSGGQTTGGVDEAPSSSGGSSSHIYA
jgi:hypothetical protein